MTMRLILAAALVVTAAVPSAAAPKAFDVRTATADFFTCVVRRHQEDARALLLQPADSVESNSAMRRMLVGDCLGGEGYRVSQLRLQPEQVRYGVADALVAREFPTTFPATIGQVAPLVHVEPVFDKVEFRRSRRFKSGGPKELEKAQAENATYHFMSRFGECIVRRNPGAAHRLLLTRPTSKEEGLALAAVKPALPTCIGEGQKLSINLYMIRGATALNFYRLARAAQPVVAGAR